jgi:hypothetical protein
MKAYLLSRENGVIQIGRTVYTLPLRTKFEGTRKGLKKYPSCDVKENSWEEAEKAYKELAQS